MHTVPPSPSAQSGVPYLRKRSRSPWFSLPAPSAVSPPQGPHSAKAVWFSPWYGCCLGFNTSASLPLQPHFRLFLQSVTPASIPYSSSFTGLHSKSGQVWPHGMEPIFSKLSHRRCNQGVLLPNYILCWSHSHLPGSKHGHIYLTYLCNQLKVIDMLNDHTRGKLQSCCYAKQLWMALLHLSLPPAQACGGEDILYLFF